MGANLNFSAQVSKVKSNKKSADSEGDAVVYEPGKDEAFGKKKAGVAYVEHKNELGLRGDSELRGLLLI